MLSITDSMDEKKKKENNVKIGMDGFGNGKTVGKIKFIDVDFSILDINQFTKDIEKPGLNTVEVQNGNGQ